MKKKIEARVIADSKNEHGQRITTYVLTYPRFIHAECKTHRVLANDDSYYEDTSLMNEEMFSRNAASSRAIPTSRMIKDIEEDPFIPVAWQKAHKGMQGIEYFEKPTEITPRILSWKQASLQSVEKAKGMLDLGITKQLVNRILEPFQWYTCIVTATEYDNFFELRCPQYSYKEGEPSFKSKKDYTKFYVEKDRETMSTEDYDCITDLEWLKINKGQGEIHISLLAEAMWDAMNESTPKELKAGEWHIPFGDKLDKQRIYDYRKVDPETHSVLSQAWVNDDSIKIATARCARVSYLNFEGKDDYEADIKLYDILKSSGHFSPFEHCARAMSAHEWHNTKKSELTGDGFKTEEGWSGNFRGFVQLRKEIE